MLPKADFKDFSQNTSVNRKLSHSRDAPDSHEPTKSTKQQKNRELTLKMLFREVIFCLTLALVTYGALHNTTAKISKYPSAARFFSLDSPVTDWYAGQLSEALDAINQADVSFVMYYAPWDAESQYVRNEFERAAFILSDWVHFSAINCWSPGSECRLHHSKISSWPILIAYTVTSRAVLYKGPRDAHSMVNFLELIITPLDKISSAKDMVQLLSICDGVAVGYTPIQDTSKYYNVWYNVALKIREFDPVGEICFAVVTSEDLAVSFGVSSIPSVRLMLWNDTKDYLISENSDNTWSESSLVVWVLENFTQPVARIMPMWKKAFNFEKYVNGKPLLMLFTPLNPLYRELPSYGLLREVAMEYYNCKNNDSSQWTSELIKLQQMQRLLYQQQDFLKLCEEYKFERRPPINRYYRKDVVSHNNKYIWNNTSQKSLQSAYNLFVKQGLGISKVVESADDNLQYISSLDNLKDCNRKLFPAEKKFYDIYDFCHSFEERLSETPEGNSDIVETSMLPDENDPFFSENLLRSSMKHYCKLVNFASEWGLPVYPAHVQNITHIQGLACAHNFSLNMVAIDSVDNHHFAESLGVDIKNKKDMTSVVILDSKLETQYVLSEEYSAKSLRDFIYNFTYKRLKRSLRTHVPDAFHTHYFASNGKTSQMGINKDTVHMIELTTDTFDSVVNTPGTVTVVGVCGSGGGCGAGAARSLLETARLLTACGVSVQVARLDALRHDLPWHYTTHAYPTIIVFPAEGGEANSQSYPSNEHITTSGLVSLVLRSLGTPQYLRVRLELCSKSQTKTEKKSCLKSLKEHLIALIGRHLKYWRRTGNRALKDALFHRLQHLHRVSLELSIIHVDDLLESNVKQRSLVNSLSGLSNIWYIGVLRNVTKLQRTKS